MTPQPPIARPQLSKINYDAPALSDDTWQAEARAFIEAGENTLWTSAGRAGLTFLKERGLPAGVLISNSLGFNSRERNMVWGETPVWLSEGVSIPWLINDKIWRITIRRLTGDKDKRYLSSKEETIYSVENPINVFFFLGE